MNRVVTLSQLSEQIAQTTGIPQAEAEKFIVGLADEISSRLSAGEHVNVPGIGTFAVGGADGVDVLWRPDRVLEQEVNAPFAFFEPVELADDVTETTLSQAMVDVDAHEPEPEPVSDEPELPTQEPVEVSPVKETVQTEQDHIATDSDEPATIEEPEELPQNPDAETVHMQQQKSRFGWLELLLGLALGLVIGFIAAVYSPNPNLTPIRSVLSGETEIENTLTDTVEAVEPEKATSAVRAETAAAIVDSNKVAEEKVAPPIEKKEITDVVTSTRYLTTMARQYYGDYHFWIYIYLHNKDIITDPDRISAGTRVRIPDAAIYGIDASSPQSIAKAQSLIESLKNGNRL